MVITDEARVILENMLKEEGKNTLTIDEIEETNQLLIDTANMENVPLINGIAVKMNDAAMERLENVVLDAYNDTDLVFYYQGGCHGNCAGCSSDCGGCSEEGCEGCGN